MFGVNYTMIPRFKNFSLPVRFIIIIGILFFNAVLFQSVATFIVMPFCNMDKIVKILGGEILTDKDRYIFLFVQAVTSAGMFAFTALLTAQIETYRVWRRLGLMVKPSLKFLVIAVVAILVAQGLIQVLVELTQKIPLPDSLKKIVDRGKQIDQLTNSLLSGTSVILFLTSTLVFAVIPALGEELFFRGLILGDMLKSKINPVVSIITTGFLFSLAHGEFDNFLAIWVLGCFLGYLYYSSGSLWVSVLAHFTNNFIVVILKYLYNTGVLKADISESDIPLAAVVISVVLFMGCVYVVYKWQNRYDFAVQLNDPPVSEEEEHDA